MCMCECYCVCVMSVRQTPFVASHRGHAERVTDLKGNGMNDERH